MTQTPLHAQNPTGRFAGRGEAYARWRPDYPAAALESILGPEPRGVPLATAFQAFHWFDAEPALADDRKSHPEEARGRRRRIRG